MDDLWLMVGSANSYCGRPGARKDGEPIAKVQFKQFLNLTMQFLSDPESYLIFLDKYILNFFKLAKGETKIEGFVVSANQILSTIIDQLEQRKNHLEKSLIENDNESEKERIAIRGEIKGIEYALQTIKINK